jgi:hypothetical protein
MCVQTPSYLTSPFAAGLGRFHRAGFPFCGPRPQGSARGGAKPSGFGEPFAASTGAAAPGGSSDSTADGIEAVIRDHVTGDEIHRTLVLAGRLTGESMDADRLTLPGTQEALITAVAAANPRTIVATLGAGPVIMPWLQGVPAVIHAWFPGEQFAPAVADVLAGRAESGGRLSITFPVDESTTPIQSPEQYPGVGGVTTYSEDLLVGYRWYQHQAIEPAYRESRTIDLRLGANDCLEIAALRAGAAYHQFWIKANLLMIMRFVAVDRLNFIKKQLGRPATNSESRLTD